MGVFRIEGRESFCYNPSMKGCPSMVWRLRLGAFLAASALAAGCARFPEGTSITTVLEMSFHIDFKGPINDAYFYFIPIDTVGGGEGPTPVFPSPGSAVDEWVTGSANYYVEYHQRQYTLYQIISLHPFESKRIGAPIRSTPPDVGGTTLRFTINLNEIGATGESVDVNFIAVNQLFPDGRLLDSLGDGRIGERTQFLILDIATDRTFSNLGPDNPLLPEPENDVADQNGAVQPASDLTSPLDIVDWSITVDV